MTDIASPDIDQRPAGPVRVVVAGITCGATLSTAETAALFQCSPELLQREVGTGRLPVEPLTLGHRLRRPTLLVAQAIGLPAKVEVETP